MATFVLTSAMTIYGTAFSTVGPGPGNPTVAGTITTGATDLSDHISEVALDLDAADVDFTNFGSGGYIEKKPGLLDADVQVTFFNDFAASNIDSILWTAFSTKLLTYWDFKPTNAARGTGNPSFVFALYVAKYPPGGFTIGDAATTQVGFMSAGKYARLTA